MSYTSTKQPSLEVSTEIVNMFNSSKWGSPMVGFRVNSHKITKANPSHPRLYNIIADIRNT